MKDFSSYARQIAEELMLKYPERASKEADECLHGYVVTNGRKNVGYVIRPQENGFYFGIVPAAKKMWEAIKDYAEKVETYEGELNEWSYREEQRVYNMARDMVIEKINNGKN